MFPNPVQYSLHSRQLINPYQAPQGHLKEDEYQPPFYLVPNIPDWHKTVTVTAPVHLLQPKLNLFFKIPQIHYTIWTTHGLLLMLCR